VFKKRMGVIMRKFAKASLGVTLLEIMLVLAIAAMIIVMSVRYYQSASSSQQANRILAQIQSITAAADSLAQASGSYLTANISNTTILPLLPANGLTSPWGDSITVTATAANAYSVAINTMPASVCGPVKAQLAANAHFDVSNVTCPGAGSTTTFTYKYISNI
jgi:type II secretory pathway pseudopilin PulG